MKVNLKYGLVLFCFTFILQGCSYLFIKQERLKDTFLKPKLPIKTYCEYTKEITNPVSLGQQESANTISAVINEIIKKHKISEIDYFVLTTLLQIKIRPDSASPTGRLQAFIHLNGKNKYWDFHIHPAVVIKNSDYTYLPVIYGLDTLLREYKSKYTIVRLTKLLDNSINQPLLVGPELEDYIQSNIGQLAQYHPFKRKYFKGDQTVRIGESIGNIRLSKIVNHYQKMKRKIAKNVYRFDNHLFDYQVPNSQLSIQCNRDLKLYDQKIYPVGEQTDRSIQFGMLLNRKSYFLATINQDIGKPKPLLGTPLFKGTPPLANKPYCRVKDTQNNEYNFIVTNDRDPGQFIHQVVNKINNKGLNVSNINKLVQAPRHLVLINPHRLIVESRRMSQDELNNYILTDIPIYHHENLGRIWAVGHSKKRNHVSIIKDSRSGQDFKCQN